jgi:hypothetical protein
MRSKALSARIYGRENLLGQSESVIKKAEN